MRGRTSTVILAAVAAACLLLPPQGRSAAAALTIPPAKQRSIHAWMAAKLHPAGGALGICRSLQRHTVYACVIIDSAGAPLGIYEATRRDTCTYRMRILSTKLKPLKVTIVHRCF